MSSLGGQGSTKTSKLEVKKTFLCHNDLNCQDYRTIWHQSQFCTLPSVDHHLDAKPKCMPTKEREKQKKEKTQENNFTVKLAR